MPTVHRASIAAYVGALSSKVAAGHKKLNKLGQIVCVAVRVRRKEIEKE